MIRQGQVDLKSIDSEAILQTIEANAANSNLRVSPKLSISKSSVVYHLHNLGKSIEMLTKIVQNFWKMFFFYFKRYKFLRVKRFILMGCWFFKISYLERDKLLAYFWLILL